MSDDKNDDKLAAKDSNVIDFFKGRSDEQADDKLTTYDPTERITMEPVAVYTLDDGRKLVISEQTDSEMDAAETEKASNKIRRNLISMMGTDDQQTALDVYEDDISKFITYMARSYGLENLTHADVNDVVDSVTSKVFEMFKISDNKGEDDNGE